MQMYLSVPMQLKLSLNCNRNNVYGHFEQFAKLNELIESEARITDNVLVLNQFY